MWARLSSGLAGSEPTQTHCGSPARVVPPRRNSRRRQWSPARHRINTTTKSWRSISDERHLVSRNRFSVPGSSQARHSGALRRRRRSRANNLDRPVLRRDSCPVSAAARARSCRRTTALLSELQRGSGAAQHRGGKNVWSKPRVLG